MKKRPEYKNKIVILLLTFIVQRITEYGECLMVTEGQISHYCSEIESSNKKGNGETISTFLPFPCHHQNNGQLLLGQSKNTILLKSRISVKLIVNKSNYPFFFQKDTILCD